MKPQDESSEASLLGLRRSKHGDRTLPWRRWNRSRRRKALGARWTSVMADVKHPVATMWESFWAKWAPEIAGQSPRLHKGLPGWKSFKKQARKAAP